jgi:hypothetical protein
MPPRQLLPEGSRGGVRIGFAVISTTACLAIIGVGLAVFACLFNSWALGVAAGWSFRSAVVVLRPLTSPFQWGFEQAASEAVEKN